MNLLLALRVILQEQASLLQRWVRLTVKLKESADHFTKFSHVRTAVTLVKAEFVLEQLVLLLEDGDVCERI